MVESQAAQQCCTRGERRNPPSAQRPAVILPTLAHSRHRGLVAASHCTKLRESDSESEHEHDFAEMRHVSGPVARGREEARVPDRRSLAAQRRPGSKPRRSNAAPNPHTPFRSSAVAITPGDHQPAIGAPFSGRTTKSATMLGNTAPRTVHAP
jgi:hypothetical protein